MGQRPDQKTHRTLDADVADYTAALRKNETRLNQAHCIAGMGDFIWEVETGEITWSEALFDLSTCWAMINRKRLTIPRSTRTSTIPMIWNALPNGSTRVSLQASRSSLRMNIDSSVETVRSSLYAPWVS